MRDTAVKPRDVATGTPRISKARKRAKKRITPSILCLPPVPFICRFKEAIDNEHTSYWKSKGIPPLGNIERLRGSFKIYLVPNLVNAKPDYQAHGNYGQNSAKGQENIFAKSRETHLQEVEAQVNTPSESGCSPQHGKPDKACYLDFFSKCKRILDEVAGYDIEKSKNRHNCKENNASYFLQVFVNFLEHLYFFVVLRMSASAAFTRSGPISFAHLS
jgi:hypothetical protein